MKNDTNELIEHLNEQNELLKAQLMNTSLIHELTKVLHSCTDFEGIIKTVLLAIQEIIEFDRVILFKINKNNFCLQPGNQVGIKEEETKYISIPLGFEGGEITDALFLNRHILVEQPDRDDPFFQQLNSKSYLIIPLVSKLNKKCWEAKSCTRTMCPAYSSCNPYCWSIPGSTQLNHATSENQRRAECIECSCFKVEGVLWMDRNISDLPISSDNITTLTAILNMAGIVIENFRILNDLDRANTGLQQANQKLKLVNHDLQLAQAKIRGDLEHARTIQQGLLPQNLESTSAFSLGARYLSADAVGGDYYDVFSISPGVFGLVVADVSGHGVASALIMSMAKILLKTFAANEQSPQKTLERINQTLLSEVNTDNFVTIFYAVVDTASHCIRHTSAGHCPILLFDRKTKSCSRIKADGLFMGVFDDMMLTECQFSYVPGNIRMVLYTDGLIEAKKNSDEMYGVERLTQCALKTLEIPPEQAVDLILQDQKTFSGDTSIPDDDITILVIDL
ncbi:MAG TPA: PP2C family protein-serine/threonine phosphatase [Chitinispirillaceae bacterium]|nr:PP2C family protein-serine/threonine phosphatase [Chitinispirillaceae bacterium]